MILDKVDSVSRKYEKVFIFHIREKKTRNSYVICPLNFSYFIFTKWQNASFFSYFIFTKSQNAFFFIFLIYFLKFFFRYFIFLIFAFLHISYLHFYCLQRVSHSHEASESTQRQNCFWLGCCSLSVRHKCAYHKKEKGRKSKLTM